MLFCSVYSRALLAVFCNLCKYYGISEYVLLVFSSMPMTIEAISRSKIRFFEHNAL